MNEKLYNTMVAKGYPEGFSKIVATELQTEFTSKRMIGYINARDETLPLEEVADEMMAILSDRDRIKNKHIAENAQAAVNLWYRYSKEEDMGMQEEIIQCVEGDDEFVAEKLNEITDSKIDCEDTTEEELVVFKVTDEGGNIIAGCNLIISCWKVADLDILWVEEKYRKQGIGSALIRQAESAAREKGCLFMTLGTFDFQAKPLYEKHGFSVCGTIEDCPTKGHTHYDMIKHLDGPSDERDGSASCPFDIQPGDEDDAEYIDDKLVEYNWSQVPAVHDFEWIGKKVQGDKEAPIAAGFAGVNFWDYGFITMLWVDEPQRNQGIGSSLLLDMEEEARKIGAHIVLVDARDWNVGFFEKHGYTVYCTLKDYPKGHNKYKMIKRL